MVGGVQDDKKGLSFQKFRGSIYPFVTGKGSRIFTVNRHGPSPASRGKGIGFS